MSDVRDVIVIGGGPAGYTAALYAARANLQPLVIEGFGWGGQLMITSDVENYPGYPDGVIGPKMMEDFRRQAERFGAEFVTADVDRVDLSASPFGTWVGSTEYRSEALIISTGASARMLGLPSEAREAIYHRLWEVLSGRDTSPKYAALSASDRRAVLEILRDTKPDLPAYFAN